jgi:multicomponent K+:H+ antiporter subunit F
MSFDTLLLSGGWLLAAAQAGPAPDRPEAGELALPLLLAVTAGVFVLVGGMAFCLLRLVRGPELADRVLAADLLSLHVVGLVVLLTIYIGDLAFFDATLAVSILGFVSTVGFAQYIYATADRRPGEPRRALRPATQESHA